jgi:hypothetical protein
MQGDAQNLRLINYPFTTISSTVFSNFHELQQKQHVAHKLLQHIACQDTSFSVKS